MSYHVVPITLREACVFVARHHRHHPAPRGGLFAVGVARGAEVVGVAVVGRPVARQLQDGWTAEVTRLCVVPGLPMVRGHAAPAASLLLGAAWRAARALGWKRLVTYTLQTEPGTTLRAAGWRCVGETKAEGWSRPSRPRVDLHPTQAKLRWEMFEGAAKGTPSAAPEKEG
jgi:hypothetical protein